MLCHSAAIEDMQKCFVLAVDIGHEMLRTLGQVRDGLFVHGIL